MEGSGKLKINEDTHHLEKDDSVYVPPNSKQFIENIGSIDLRFFEDMVQVKPILRLKEQRRLSSMREI